MAAKSTKKESPKKLAPPSAVKSGGKHRTRAKKATVGERGRVRRFVEERLLKSSDSYTKIAEDARSKFEGAKTSPSSTRWYASRLRAAGTKVPDRETGFETQAN